MEAYKGVGTLLAAFAQAGERIPEDWRLVLAGRGDLAKAWRGALPARVEVRNRFIGDAEAVDLFRRCSLVVLPYIDATQSALPAAAYFFHKPVLVTRSGALAEYVVEGETGFVVRPGDVDGLAEGLAEAAGKRDQLARMGEAGRRWYDERREGDTARLEALYAQAARL
jgi:alpha-maltose-1-phosphate synthase